jgi:hypothetical protein
VYWWSSLLKKKMWKLAKRIKTVTIIDWLANCVSTRWNSN